MREHKNFTQAIEKLENIFSPKIVPSEFSLRVRKKGSIIKLKNSDSLLFDKVIIVQPVGSINNCTEKPCLMNWTFLKNEEPISTALFMCHEGRWSFGGGKLENQELINDVMDEKYSEKCMQHFLQSKISLIQKKK